MNIGKIRKVLHTAERALGMVEGSRHGHRHHHHKRRRGVGEGVLRQILRRIR
jgi:hypothetical protein